MTGSYMLCDHCKTEHRMNMAEMGMHHHMGMPAPFPEPNKWITLMRQASGSVDAIRAGQYHFCSDRCLALWLQRQTAGARERTSSETQAALETEEIAKKAAEQIGDRPDRPS